MLEALANRRTDRTIPGRGLVVRVDIASRSAHGYVGLRARRAPAYGFAFRNPGLIRSDGDALLLRARRLLFGGWKRRRRAGRAGVLARRRHTDGPARAAAGDRNKGDDAVALRIDDHQLLLRDKEAEVAIVRENVGELAGNSREPHRRRNSAGHAEREINVGHRLDALLPNDVADARLFALVEGNEP